MPHTATIAEVMRRPTTITPPHFAVLALMEERIARHLALPMLEVEGLCRDLAAAGLLPDVH